jgi:uncharacterized membrane protein YfcA
VPEGTALDVSINTYLLGFLAVFIAGIVKGLTGFGFSLMAVPVLVLLLGPRTAIPVIVVLNAFTNVVLFAGCRRAANLRRIVPLIIAGVATVPIGTYLLLILEPISLKLIVGCVTVAFALAFLVGFRRPIRKERGGFLLAGLLSGTLNGVISTAGPPVILFLTNQGVTKTEFRANLVGYFLFLNMATVPIYFAGGLMSRSVGGYAAVLIPALLLGAFLGSRLLRVVPEKTFRAVALLIVVVAGLLSVLSSIGMI